MKIVEYKNRILNFFTSKHKEKKTDTKNYLTKLVENLEIIKSENKTIYFFITAVKEKGFQIKVGGLYGFVSFHHMPWHYNSPKYWKVISQELITRVISGVVM